MALTPLAGKVLALLLTLTPYKTDTETPEARAARLGVIATAIDRATVKVSWEGGRRDLARALVTLGWHESRFAAHVHAGRCGPLECDRGRARSLWQLHRRAAGADWDRIANNTQDGTDRAAFRAARILSAARRRCGSLKGAFAGYALGGGCTWKGAVKRARWFHRRAVLR